RLNRLIGSATHAHPRKDRTRFPLAVESLEGRALLATFTVGVGGGAVGNDPNVFTPSSITIHQGDTVEWVWEGGLHNVQSVRGIADQWNSGTPTAVVGTTSAHPFTQVGTFAYYDADHGSDPGNGTATGMHGTVPVEATTPTPPPVTVVNVQFTQ